MGCGNRLVTVRVVVGSHDCRTTHLQFAGKSVEPLTGLAAAVNLTCQLLLFGDVWRFWLFSLSPSAVNPLWWSRTCVMQMQGITHNFSTNPKCPRDEAYA